ncbi:MAG: D-alanyl-D-alanine carboxypeptidase/D-alanyl-D-alanine-endopeptidase [Betaproteobacteria bacterium]
MLHRCIAIGLLLAACSCPVLAQAPLPPSTIDLLRAANIPNDAVGAIAIRVGDGAVVLSHGDERSLQPASTLKLLTAIVALERLGPAWRARTEMVAVAPAAAGRLEGDLILRGGGSPDFDWRALQRMLQQLRFQGVRRIAGDLVLDRALFQPPRVDIGLPPFDETPEFRYNVIPDALLLNTNLVQIDLAAGIGKLRAQMTPMLQRVHIDTSDMKIVERRCDLWEDGWRLPSVVRTRGGRIRIVLHGEFPAGCNATTSVNVLDRVEFADRLFRALWRSAGGRFDGKVRDGISPAGARLLAEHQSRTLAEIVRDVVKRSDNPVTRQLYLTLGTLPVATAGAIPTLSGSTTGAIPADTAARAEQVVRAWLSDHGLSGAGLVLENGSGLSRRERITPALLAGVIAAAARSDWAPEFLATLPIVGVDGAMERRLAGSPAAVRSRFKTGTLRNAVSIAGFVADATGHLCILVAIVNQEPTGPDWAKAARPVLDSLIDWVARSGGK